MRLSIHRFRCFSLPRGNDRKGEPARLPTNRDSIETSKDIFTPIHRVAVLKRATALSVVSSNLKHQRIPLLQHDVRRPDLDIEIILNALLHGLHILCIIVPMRQPLPMIRMRRIRLPQRSPQPALDDGHGIAHRPGVEDLSSVRIQVAQGDEDVDVGGRLGRARQPRAGDAQARRGVAGDLGRLRSDELELDGLSLQRVVADGAR